MRQYSRVKVEVEGEEREEEGEGGRWSSLKGMG